MATDLAQYYSRLVLTCVSCFEKSLALIVLTLLCCTIVPANAVVENFDAPLGAEWNVLNVNASVANGQLVTTGPNAHSDSWEKELNKVYQVVSITGDFVISTACDYVANSSDLSTLVLFLTFADGNTVFAGMGDAWSGYSGEWIASSSVDSASDSSGKGTAPSSGTFTATISRTAGQISCVLNGQELVTTFTNEELVKVGLTHTKYQSYATKTAYWDYLEISEPSTDFAILNPTRYFQPHDSISIQTETSFAADSYSAQSLPAGLTLDATTGLIGGALAVPDDYLFQVSARLGGLTTYKWIHLRALPLIPNVAPKLHWDASLEVETSTAQATDISGNGNNGTAPQAIPIVTENTVPVYSFENQNNVLTFPRATDIRSVFWVTRRSNKYAFLLGDSTEYHFHIGANNVVWNDLYANDFILNGITRTNGIEIDGKNTAMPVDLSVISLVTTGNVQANSFSQDRVATFGDRSWRGVLGELIIFNTALTPTQVTEYETYLSAKWLNPKYLLEASAVGGTLDTAEASLVTSGNIEITVTPDSGQSFSHWEGATPVSQSGDLYTFDISEDTELVAHFASGVTISVQTCLGSEEIGNFEVSPEGAIHTLDVSCSQYDDVIVSGQFADGSYPLAKVIGSQLFLYSSEIDTSGLKAWYRPEELASDNFGKAQGATVDVWRDALGLSSISQSASHQQPRYEPDLANGHAGLFFESNGSSSDRLSGGYLHDLASKPLTVSVVYALRGLNGTSAAPSCSNSVVWADGPAGDDLILGSVYNADTYSVKASSEVFTGSMGEILYEKDRFVVVTYRYDPVSDINEYWVNGVYQGSRGGLKNYNDIGLGRTDNCGANAYVSELLIYERALEEANREELEVYLADKYGLYHPDAQWIADFDPQSQAAIHLGMLDREEFFSINGQYALDAPWITSYSLAQQAYIHANTLNLMDVPILPGPLPSAFDFTDGLVLYTPLTEASNTNDIDLSPAKQQAQWKNQSGNDISDDSVNRESDRFDRSNSAPTFANQSLIIPDGFSLTNAITISVWTKALGDNMNGDLGALIGGYDGDPVDDDNFVFFQRSNGGLWFSVSHAVDDGQTRSGSGSSYFWDPDPELRWGDEWNQIGGRYDGTSVTSFRNGATVGSEKLYDGLINQNPRQAVGIGARNDGTFFNYNGLMNDVMVWDRALSDDELELLHFIQLDPTRNAELQGLLSGVSPVPQIAGVSYDGVALTEGAVIDLGDNWEIDLATAINIRSVNLYVDDSLAGSFRRLDSNTYLLDSVFDVTPGYHAIEIVVTNVDGVSDSFTSDLQFVGTVAPQSSPMIDAVSFEGTALVDGAILIGSGDLTVDVLPDDLVSVSEVRYTLTEVTDPGNVLTATSQDAASKFVSYLNLQGQDGKDFILRVEAENPFFDPVVHEYSVSVESPRLWGTVELEWAVSTDLVTEADAIEYEFWYSIGGGEGTPDENAATWVNEFSGETVALGTEIAQYPWNVSNFEDATDVYLRIRSYDGEKYSEYDVSGPYDIDNGAPENASVNFLAGTSTSDPVGTLELFADGATEMRISEDIDFTSVDWIPYADSYVHNYSSGLGTKTVYAAFRDLFDQETIISNSIEFLPERTIFLDASNIPQGETYITIAEDEWGPGDAIEIDGGGNTLTVVIEDSDVTVTQLVLKNGAVLTTPATTISTEYRLNLKVLGILSIDLDSMIDVSARGYPSRRTQGNVAYTAGNGYWAGSYGGHGGHRGGSNGISNPLYGDFAYPTDLGSGSGSQDGGRPGGGAIHLLASEFVLDGGLYANGAVGRVSSHAGGGSGGSILLEVNRLTGSGHISANGGNSNTATTGGWYASGGGGGRIAIYYDTTDTDFPFDTNVTAYGGDAHYDGGAGTVYLSGPDYPLSTLSISSSSEPIWFGQRNDFSDDPNPINLSIDNVNNVPVSFELAPDAVFENLAVTNDLSFVNQGALTIETLQVGGALTVDNTEITSESITVGGHFSLSSNAVITTAAAPEDGLFVSTDSFSMDLTSALDVSGQGYPAGLTLGLSPFDVDTAAGSYAGYGGSAGDLLATYGDFRDPKLPGSGGDASSGGGAGGGVVEVLVTNLLNIDGQILADGVDGGAGGSILIEAGSVGLTAFNSLISAQGGSGVGATLGGGGGGRIAIYADALNANADTLIASGGTTTGGSNQGSAGTIYTEYLSLDSPGVGTLIVDNFGVVTDLVTPLRSVGSGKITSFGGAGFENTFFDDLANFPLPSSDGALGLFDLWIQPDTGESTFFRVISNDAQSITVFEDGTTLQSVAHIGDFYQGVIHLNTLTIRGNAKVETGDLLAPTTSLEEANGGELIILNP